MLQRKRSRLTIGEARPPGEDGDDLGDEMAAAALTPTPRRSLTKSFIDPFGAASLGPWAPLNAGGGVAQWEDNGAEDLDWQPSQQGGEGACGGGGGPQAPVSPRGAHGCAAGGGDAAMSPQPDAVGGCGGEEVGQTAWMRFLHAQSTQGQPAGRPSTCPAVQQAQGEEHPGGEEERSRWGAVAKTYQQQGEWESTQPWTQALTQHGAPPGTHFSQPAFGGEAGSRDAGGAGALWTVAGGEGEQSFGVGPDGTQRGAARSRPAFGDAADPMVELQQQERYWAGAFPPAASQGEVVRPSNAGGHPHTAHTAVSPPLPPLDTDVEDVTRTPPPPPVVPQFCAAALAVPLALQHPCEMSPGEGRCSQYIHSPVPLHLSQGHVLDAAAEQYYGGQEQVVATQMPDDDAIAANGGGHCPSGTADVVGEVSLSQPPRPALFPIFLPRGSRTVHLVRHGESAYNEACGRPGSSWDEPQIFDAPLTALGRSQAQALGSKLAHLLGPSCLWVTSPLTRAIQTCVLARQAVAAHSPDAWPMPSSQQAWVTVRAEATEHLATAGDVGRPPSELAREFPDLAAAGVFGTLPDVWWFSPPSKPNCCARRIVGTNESRDQCRVRTRAFRKWIMMQTSSELVVFGHSTFFKYFMMNEGLGEMRLKNGEVFTLKL